MIVKIIIKQMLQNKTGEMLCQWEKELTVQKKVDQVKQVN